MSAISVEPEMIDKVSSFVKDRGRVSISGIQREFRLNYHQAKTMVDELEELKVVSPPNDKGYRDVYRSEGNRVVLQTLNGTTVFFVLEGIKEGCKTFCIEFEGESVEHEIHIPLEKQISPQEEIEMVRLFSMGYTIGKEASKKQR